MAIVPSSHRSEGKVAGSDTSMRHLLSVTLLIAVLPGLCIASSSYSSSNNNATGSFLRGSSQYEGVTLPSVLVVTPGRRNLQDVKCADAQNAFRYLTKQRTSRTRCRAVRNLNKKKLNIRCARSLADLSGRTVADMCPNACLRCGEGAVATTTTTTATTTAVTKTTVQTMTPTTQKKPMDYDYDHVIDRVDSDSSACIPFEDDGTPPVLVAVSNREVYVACHSFEDYMSPKFRTVFVLYKAFAKEWRIDELVRDATCRDTMGATLLMLEGHGGEILGRRVALEYIKQEAADVELLQQMNCDVHPLPSQHNLYKPLDETVMKMARDFTVARAQREPDSYPDVDYPSFELADNLKSNDKRHRRGLLAMSAMLFEHFPSNKDVLLDFHGNDACKWEISGGRAARPSKFGKNDPWLCDTDIIENHALMYDVEKLQMIRYEYMDIPGEWEAHSFASDTRFTPRVADKYKLRTVYNRDVYLHQDFAEPSDAMDDYPSYVDLDWIRVQSLDMLGKNRGPYAVYNIWNAFNSAGLDTYMGNNAIGFAWGHAFSSGQWYPEHLEGKSLEEGICKTMVQATMGVFGYEELEETGSHWRYGLTGVYPGNVYVMATTSRSEVSRQKDYWEFLQIKSAYSGKVIRYVALGSVESSDMREMQPEDRIVEVPKQGTIHSLSGPWAIEDRKYMHKRGRYRRDNTPTCGPPDQDPDTACGFLEDSQFDHPYRD